MIEGATPVKSWMLYSAVYSFFVSTGFSYSYSVDGFAVRDSRGRLSIQEILGTITLFSIIDFILCSCDCCSDVDFKIVKPSAKSVSKVTYDLGCCPIVKAEDSSNWDYGGNSSVLKRFLREQRLHFQNDLKIILRSTAIRGVNPKQKSRLSNNVTP